MDKLVKYESVVPYTCFAKAYAAEGELLFSEKSINLIFSLLGSFAGKITHVADLACGAGGAVEGLAQMGLSVIGVDASMQMISEARKRIDPSNNKVEFYCQDMRELKIPSPVDLVISTYDSINFMINEEDLKKVFTKVFMSLRSPGFFVFDIYTLFGLKKCWGTQTEIHTNSLSNFITTRTSCIESDIGIKEFFGFTLDNDLWVRWYEKHVVRAYHLQKMRELLLDCGFKEDISLYDIDDFVLKPVEEHTKRAMIFAQKN